MPEGDARILRRQLQSGSRAFEHDFEVTGLAGIEGGIEGLERRSAEKAGMVYRVIDESDGFYRNPVDERVRSHMNVVFRHPTEALEREFISEASSAGLIGLKGHRSVGGCRASLYAALSSESVARLVDFMVDFRSRAG